MSERTWTVKSLSMELERAFDRFFPNVVVEGEVAQIQVPASGHAYLVLREGDATLAAVCWKSNWQSSSFRPAVGERVRCRGKLGLYALQSKYQLYVRHLEAAGDGWLNKQIQERIGRLRADGLLDPRRKRPLPRFPRVIGLATSADGAAIADFLRVSGERYPAARILLSPCKVQGPEAPASIVRALELLVEHGGCDVIVVTRGGGSKEDLLAFQDEALARAIAAMPVPVVSAVGHEIDTTIADLVADVVAPTPSAAALAVLPDAFDLARRVDEAAGALDRAIQRQLRTRKQRVSATAARLRHPSDRLRAGRRALIALRERLHGAARRGLITRQERLIARELRLRALSPLAVLDRGYAIVAAPRDGVPAVITSPRQVAPGDRLEVRLAGGLLPVRVLPYDGPDQGE